MSDGAATSGRTWLVRILKWLLAILAIGFVAWVVPIRDRCSMPERPSMRVPVTRSDRECVLHLPSGDVPYGPAVCEALVCEPGLARTLRAARLELILSLACLYFLGTLLWAARWRALLTLARVDLSLLRTWRITLEAQAAGVLLPGGIGGDALRMAQVAGKGRPTSVAIASVVLDRIVGLATMSAIAVAMGLAFGGLRPGPLAWGLLAIPVCSIVALLLLRSPQVGRLPWLQNGWLGTRVAPVLAYVRDPKAPRAIALCILASVGVSVVVLGVHRGFVLALGGSPVSEDLYFAGLAMGFIVAALPGLPGGWGTQDAAYVYFLGLSGVSPAHAVGVCLLGRSFWYLSALVGAVLHMLPGGASKPRGEAAQSPGDG